MKKKKLLPGRIAAGAFLTVAAFSGCMREEARTMYLPGGENGDIRLVAYDYAWNQAQVADTVVLTCAQTAVYEAGGQEYTLTPQAVIKFWAEKQSVYFTEGSPVPSLNDVRQTEKTSGEQPQTTTRRQEFLLDDGQTLVAESAYDSYTLTTANGTFALPAVVPDEISLAGISAAESGDGYAVAAEFAVPWTISGRDDAWVESATVVYRKMKSDTPDELLDVRYQTGSEWDGNDALTLYVEKTETWSLSGVQTRRYDSPALRFALDGGGEKAMEVSDFAFEAQKKSETSAAEDIGGDNWRIKRHYVTQTISFDNGAEQFADAFRYPVFEAAYTSDGQNLPFELEVVFSERHRTAITGDDEMTNTTEATASFAGKVFQAAAVTVWTLKGGDKPDPEPDPEPDPTPGVHGKIIDFAVTAVLDADGLAHGGNLTKKAVVIRYEEGYEWGVCAYEEAFPATMTYTQSGYTGFNSAAQPGAGKPFRLARAVDTANTIEWYAENNELIAGIDALTCGLFGWKNIVGGRYSAQINGYQGKYGANRTTLTLTAPDGSRKTFGSDE